MGFCCEDRVFPWKSFLKNCFVQNSRARCPTIVLGSIRKDIEVIGVVLENIVKFLLISAGVGFSILEAKLCGRQFNYYNPKIDLSR